ncbi:hypothetical protein [Nocardia sp. NPDC051981]|uniref:hypothetical protein n=1 Tax=Nocardia sp. NPDC051981 TaxID=3155417 RepID=UPI0034210D21
MWQWIGGDPAGTFGYRDRSIREPAGASVLFSCCRAGVLYCQTDQFGRVVVRKVNSGRAIVQVGAEAGRQGVNSGSRFGTRLKIISALTFGSFEMTSGGCGVVQELCSVVSPDVEDSVDWGGCQVS